MKFRRALLPLLAMMIFLGASPAGAVSAAIRLSPPVGPPATSVTVKGVGFQPLEVVDLTFDLESVGAATADSQGRLLQRVTVPASATPGDHTVTAFGESSGRTASATFTVRTDWTRFAFDLANTGFNPYENVLGPDNVGSLTDGWATNTGGDRFVCAPPAVVEGVAYISAQGWVSALDATDGHVVWSSSSYSPGSAVTVGRGQVFFGSTEHYIASLDAPTGGLRWKYFTGAGVFGAPALVGKTLYATSNDGYLYALRADTGGKLWSTFVGIGLGASPALAGGLIYVTQSDLSGIVAAVNASTGKVAWSKALNDGRIDAGPVVGNGIVYVVTEHGILYALDAATGDEQWRVSGLGGMRVSSPAVSDGTVYVASPNSKLVAYDAASGTLLWQVRTGGSLIDCLAVANGVIYTGGQDGVLYAFRQTDGAVVWTTTVPGSVPGPCAVVNGTVYTQWTDNKLHDYVLP